MRFKCKRFSCYQLCSCCTSLSYDKNQTTVNNNRLCWVLPRVITPQKMKTLKIQVKLFTVTFLKKCSYRRKHVVAAMRNRKPACKQRINRLIQLDCTDSTLYCCCITYRQNTIVNPPLKADVQNLLNIFFVHQHKVCRRCSQNYKCSIANHI